MSRAQKFKMKEIGHGTGGELFLFVWINKLAFLIEAKHT